MKYKVCVGSRCFNEYEGKEKCLEVQRELAKVYTGKEISIRYKNGNIVKGTEVIIIKTELSKEETMKVLEEHFNGCLRYWERELKVDSDLSNEAYKMAIKEIPTVDPRVPNGCPLNPEWVAEFRKYRLMDCYGKEWQKYA